MLLADEPHTSRVSIFLSGSDLVWRVLSCLVAKGAARKRLRAPELPALPGPIQTLRESDFFANDQGCRTPPSRQPAPWLFLNEGVTCD